MTRTREATVEPQNLDAEEHVVGACLLGGRRALEDTRAILSPRDFYRASHAVIWSACLDLADHGDPVDPITVLAALDRQGQLETVGGRSRVHELANLVPATANAGHYAQLVREASRDRDFYRLGLELTAAASNGGMSAHPEAVAHVYELLSASDGRVYRPLDLAEMLSGPPPATTWLWDGWLVQGDLCLLVGDPKVGKSLVALGLAEAIRRGAPFLGAATLACPVGIFDLENPEPEVHSRLRRIGLTAEQHDGLHYFHQPPLDLANPDGVAALTATIRHYGLGLAVLDSFRRLAGGVDENNSAAVAGFFTPLRRITVTTGCTLIVIHHARKRMGADQDTSAGQMTRGSGDFLAAVDSQLYLRKTDPGVFTIEHGANRHGTEHQPLRVAVSSADEATLHFRSEGIAIIAETERDEMLLRVTTALREAAGGPLTSTILMLRLGIDTEKVRRKFYRALREGYERGVLAKTEPTNPKEPTEWALVPDNEVV